MAGPSQGLAADARGLILSEDVVCWADGRDGGALGLVFRVAGQSDDEALSDSGDDEVRARHARRMRFDALLLRPRCVLPSNALCASSGAAAGPLLRVLAQGAAA
jgi:hypothetical protein